MYLRGYTTASLVFGTLLLGICGWRLVSYHEPNRLAVVAEMGVVATAFLWAGNRARHAERTSKGMARMGWWIFLLATFHAFALFLLHHTAQKTINLLLIAIAVPLIFPRTLDYLMGLGVLVGTWMVAVSVVKPGSLEPWIIAWLTTVGLSLSIHLFLHRLFEDLERLEKRDRRLIREKSGLVVELRAAMANLTTLEGLIPMCAHCKKVRNDGGYWEQVEVFINSQTGRQLSHGYCPECYAEALKELDAMKAEKVVTATK